MEEPTTAYRSNYGCIAYCLGCLCMRARACSHCCSKSLVIELAVLTNLTYSCLLPFKVRCSLACYFQLSLANSTASVMELHKFRCSAEISIPRILRGKKGCGKHSCGLQHQPRAVGEVQPAALVPWLRVCIGMEEYSRGEPRFLIKVIWMLGRSERLSGLSRNRLSDI